MKIRAVSPFKSGVREEHYIISCLVRYPRRLLSAGVKYSLRDSVDLNNAALSSLDLKRRRPNSEQFPGPGSSMTHTKRVVVNRDRCPTGYWLCRASFPLMNSFVG